MNTIKLLESYIQNLNDDIPNPTNKTDFEGFDISKVSNTDNSYQIYQDFLDGKDTDFTNIYISEITPKTYMDLCSKYIAKGSENNLLILSDLDGIQKHFAKRAHEIAKNMSSGHKVPLLILDFKNKEQDGRHRAVASYINNYKTIPCLICY